MTTINRRNFVSIAAAAAAGTALAPLANLNSRVAASGGPARSLARGGGSSHSLPPYSFAVEGFGPIAASLPTNTADLANLSRLGDISNVPLLALPEGFEYSAISIGGELNTAGERIPTAHDGMAAFRGPRNTTILVRNHERSPGTSSSGTFPTNGKVYDDFGGAGTIGAGGTSNVVVDAQGNVLHDVITLAGTIRNCAGGPTPWGTWISCEENMTVVGQGGATKMHGYNFEVPAMATEAVDPVPLVEMGRFNHEAVAVDPRTGYCYQTEDTGDSCFYRFVPNVHKAQRAGDYAKGGSLYALSIKHRDGMPTRGLSVDTRGGVAGAASFIPYLGVWLEVEWVPIDEPNPSGDSVRHEAASKGATLFYRGEGAWEHRGLIYFVCSNGGDAGEGQVMVYDPKREKIVMGVESTDENLLDGPDNITIGPDGVAYLCEDGSGGTPGTPNYGQRIVGVDLTGGLFTFAHNVFDTGEFAGACFSPNGKQLFVNCQSPAITYVIRRTDGRPIRL